MGNLSEIKPWANIGKPKTLSESHGRSFVTQVFINPKTNTQEEYSFLKGHKDSTVIFPVTTEKKILILRQFRHAADDILIELPGGNIQPDESQENAARRELLEETGYEAEKIITFKTSKHWFDPSALRSIYIPCIAIGCKKITDPQQDSTEDLEIHSVSIKRWAEMIRDGLITDSKTLATTLLALQYLNESLCSWQV